jgi:hypothetical protein
MKHYKYNIFSIGLATTAMLFASCSDQFLEDKKNYDNVTPDVYNYYEGANLRLADAYSFVLPSSNSSANYRYPCTGLNDDQSASTEEYYGFSVFVDPQNIMKAESGNDYLPDYFMGDKSNIQASVYGYIRNINDVIIGIEESSLDQTYKDQFLGQAYFLRAWRYYQLVKWYGGVPIVTTLLDPTEDSYTPRSTTKETIDFILSDLEKSAELLEPYTGNGGWQSSSDWGRVTTGTALALKGRVLLLWASPIFNRANDQSRWTNAYNEMKADLPKIQACGYGLYSDASNVNGSTFAKMFMQVKSPENVFVTIKSSNDPEGNGYYNPWEETIRPRNTNGKGSLIPSEMIISQFPMKDGKRPANSTTYTKLNTSDYTYEKEYPFMNRDPRFYRTFAFPGMRWAYDGDPTQANSDNPSYDNGKNYELWSYVWYTDTNDAGDVDKSNCYGADNLLTNNKSVYVRKRSDDADVNTPLYVYNATALNQQNFRLSGAPYIELRYAEVLLNYAEAACMAGQMGEAVEQIKAVRQRVGYTGDCGLDANISGDQAACMSAILYERQIEFAYEGKRFDDMRRWMLFDGGSQTVSGAPSTWKLTGWGGNTCTWLGVTPLNGQRREGIEYRTADKYGVGATTKASDPLEKAGVERCAAVDFRKALYNITVTGEGTEDEATEDNGQLATLKNWYKENLVYKQKKGDGRLSSNDVKTDLYIQFRPEYYFLGFTSGVMTANKQLGQTIGWTNAATGGNGDFDPLAE